MELDLKWFSLLSESLCNSQGKFARRYISLSSAAPVYLYLNENCKHLVFFIFVHYLQTWKKVKMLLQKVLWDFRNSPPTLCALFCLIICTVLCCLVLSESVWFEKVHCNKVYCGFVSQKVSGWIKFFPLLSSQGTSLPPLAPHTPPP